MISFVFIKSQIPRSLLRPSNQNFAKCLRRLESTSTSASQNENSETETVKPDAEFYDIVICGGGMVGSAMAYALGKDDMFKNLRIALIESSNQAGKYESPLMHSNRTCALSETTTDFFKSLGNFDFIEDNRYGNVKHMHVWDGSSDAHISFDNEDNSNLAIIAENNLIQASLAKDLHSFENLKVHYSSQIKDFKVEDSKVDILLKDESKIRTSLLIGSDGPNSFIRQNARFNITKWDYDQVAIVGTVKLSEKAKNETAWQRFLSTGPIALLPLNDEYSSLVWSIKKPLAKELLELSNEEFASRVNNAFINEDFKDQVASNIEDALQNGLNYLRNSNLIPQINPLEEVRQLPPRIETVVDKSRGSYPLSFMHANNYIKNRIALIGDAVHRIHPLAGQGVNLGFGDVICLTEQLRENIRNGAELGTNIYLENYESIRQKEAFVKCTGIDFLNRLYTDNDYPLPIKTPLVTLRSIGLTLSNRFAPLKDFYKQQAMK